MLVAVPERWDEACFAVPAVRALVASGLSTGVLCAEVQCDFWATIENLSVVGYPMKARAKPIAAEIAGNWQASLAWEMNVAAEAFKGASIPRRLGRDERSLNRYLTHPLGGSLGPLEHRVQHYLAAVEAMGIETRRADFFAPAVASTASAGVLLSPDSDFGVSHEWSLNRWDEVAELLLGQGKSVTIACLSGGRGLGDQLAARLAERVEIFPILSLAESWPKVNRYELLVSADASLPHLAAHVGVICVTLFGPNDPLWKRPLGRQHAVVRKHVECAPCLLAKCLMDGRCQVEMETARVWRAISEKLSQ